MPSYATDAGFSGTEGAILLSALNMVTAIGQPLFGHLVHTCGSFYTPMVVRGIQVLHSRFATAVVEEYDEPSALIVYGVLTATKGFAMIMSGFIGAELGDETVQFYLKLLYKAKFSL
ncbi:hypothetical protein G7Y89_g9694 [Cudoniella acicularis]|uniref:Uncharacterized protein n=1 Tax=Cudoniella acicularis TaxID=354080 RepID=A0A8H4RE66_9HELO|nr:hypothetical protein G7Y89_g9694 [Cudoniella acicularis]